MPRLLKKLVLKTLVLILIAILPVITYIYTKDDGQYIFNINVRNDVNKYIIRAEFIPEKNSLNIDQKIEFINKADKEIDKIYLHIYPNAFKDINTAPFFEDEFDEAYPNGFDAGYFDVFDIKANGRGCYFKLIGRDKTILQINLKKPLQKREKAYINISGRLKIPNCRGRFGYGEHTYNINNWYPIVAVYDHSGWNLDPYYKIGDPFYSDIADYHVELIMPEEYIPATTGEIIRKGKVGDKVYYYIDATSVRDFAVIISNKFKIKEKTVDGIKVVSYYFDDRYEIEALEYASNSIKVFNNLFGRYPYNEYKVVASDFFVGGMEYPNIVIIDSELYRYDTPDILEYVIVHETAHQWWYGIVGNDQIDEPWLDESLTEYSGILYYENIYGKEVSDKVFDIMIKDRYDIYSFNEVNNTFINRKVTEFNSQEQYIRDIYHKGAIILRDIRMTVGDDKFFEIVRKYYNTYKFKNSNIKGFIRICKEVLEGMEGKDIEELLSIKE